MVSQVSLAYNPAVMHVYIAVGCQTKGCGVAHILKYLGEKGKAQTSNVEIWVPCPLMLECPNCHKTYDYHPLQEKYFQQELPYPPPADYSNKLGPPLDHKKPLAN
jgi:hypothetical protein